MIRRRQPEKEIQAQIVRLLRQTGCAVWVLGTHRRRGEWQGTMQSPGLPDLIGFLPRRLGVVFIEVKAPGGRLRPEQQLFKAEAEALQRDVGTVWYVTGGLDAVRELLQRVGVVSA